MFTMHTVGVGCYLIALFIVLLFSVVYLCRSSFMPYHQQAVRRTWDEVDPAMQKLLMALIHALGFAWFTWMLCCVFLLIILLSSTFSPVVWMVFQALVLLSLLAPIMIASGLRRHTGAKTPVAGGAVAALFSTLGFTLLMFS